MYYLNVKFSKKKILLSYIIPKFEISKFLQQTKFAKPVFNFRCKLFLLILSCYQPSISNTLLKSVYEQKKNMEA